MPHGSHMVITIKMMPNRSTCPQGKSPYLNQIDYVCLKEDLNITVYDLKSYRGMHTNSNRKLVLPVVAFKWKYSKSVRSSERLNSKLLYDSENRTQHNSEAAKQVSQERLPTNTLERWADIINATAKAAHKIDVLKRDKRSCKQRN